MKKISDGAAYSHSQGDKPEKLVVMLHGVGSDGYDLIQIAKIWGPQMPEVDFVSPHAPELFDMANQGYQWFSLKSVDPKDLLEGANHARKSLDIFIDEQLKQRGLTEKDLILMGFSQGTMMALHCGLQRQLAGIVGYSGALLMEDNEKPKTKAPVLLVHGADDSIVPCEASKLAADKLTKDGLNVELHIRPGLPHSIDDYGLDLGFVFIKRIVGGTLN